MHSARRWLAPARSQLWSHAVYVQHLRNSRHCRLEYALGSLGGLGNEEVPWEPRVSAKAMSDFKMKRTRVWRGKHIVSPLCCDQHNPRTDKHSSSPQAAMVCVLLQVALLANYSFSGSTAWNGVDDRLGFWQCNSSLLRDQVRSKIFLSDEHVFYSRVDQLLVIASYEEACNIVFVIQDNRMLGFLG